MLICVSAVSAGGSKLKKIYFKFNRCLDSVDPGVLARGLNSFDDVFISPTNLTREQAEAFFTAITGGTKLKIINMALCNLALLKPALLAKALNMLEVVNMTKSGHDNHQLNAIAIILALGPSKLKSWKIHCVNIFSVEPGLLARAVNRLEEAGMDMTKLKQVEATITTLVKGDSRLKNLNITCDSITTMDPELLARAFSALENIHLSCKELTEEQTKEIFTALAAEDSKLVLLNLSGQIPLASVKPQLLARAFNQLLNLHISCQPMTKQQMKEIFSTISTGDSKLKIRQDPPGFSRA